MKFDKSRRFNIPYPKRIQFDPNNNALNLTSIENVNKYKLAHFKVDQNHTKIINLFRK